MKAAPVVEELRARGRDWSVRLVHTGQHYDEKLSDIFFRQLAMPPVRKNTERPVTIDTGGQRLAGEDPELALSYVNEALNNGHAPVTVPELWDGGAASRIVDVLEGQL